MVSGNDAVTIPENAGDPLTPARDADIDFDITGMSSDTVSGNDPMLQDTGSEPSMASTASGEAAILETETVVAAIDRLNVSMQAGFITVSLLLGLLIGVVLIKGFFIWRS